MTTAFRTYRGATYRPTKHEQASSSYVEHVYRGKKYQAPLNHEAAPINESVELHYRGSVYHHRQKDASFSMKS